jgi:poly-gamma-glutamate capsule biosynthesis protein CapA/YwtB (metallophosphatase superfamily)
VKRLIPFLVALVAGFIFFAFLSRTENTDTRIKLFYEENSRDSSVVAKEVETQLREHSLRVSVHSFDPARINIYILSNPHSIFIAKTPLRSPLFPLHQKKVLTAKVFITRLDDTRYTSVSGKTFDEILDKQRFSDSEILRRISRGKADFGIISYQHLDLHVRPIPVDGVFPDLASLRSSTYKKVYRAGVYTEADTNILNDTHLDGMFSAWLDNAFSLVAAGDIMLSRGVANYIDEYGSDYPFDRIRDEIEKYDIAFANLESVISSNGSRFRPYKGIYFRADPSAIEGLAHSGFNVFSLGNNHALDWGADALNDTMSLLKARGLKYTGAGHTLEQACMPAVFTVRNTTIAFIALNDIYPFSVYENGKKSMQTLSLEDPQLEQRIKNLKKYDILVASVHAGAEYINEPEVIKKQKIRRLIDYGVDIVIGSHPHVVQGLEVYGNGLIAYSLGNCIFDQSWSRETSTGMLLEITFLGKKPLYFRPQMITIDHAQAKLINSGADRPRITLFLRERKKNEYAKN